MTFERTELVKHYMKTEGLGLPQAAAKVKNMTDAEVQEKREQIAKHTNTRRARR